MLIIVINKYNCRLESKLVLGIEPYVIGYYIKIYCVKVSKWGLTVRYFTCIMVLGMPDPATC